MFVSPPNYRIRQVYFHALSSTKEFSVPNYVLQNETLATSPSNYYEFHVLGDRGPNGQSSASYYDDRTQVLFYTQVNKDAIHCWNTQKEYVPEQLSNVESDTDKLVFPNDLKIDDDGNLWVLSNRMPKFLFGKLDSSKFNYRVLKGKTTEIIKGTNCE